MYGIRQFTERHGNTGGTIVGRVLGMVYGM